MRLVPSRIGRPEQAQRPELAQQLEVVVGGLAEPEARIDDEILPRQPETQGAFDGALEVRDELGQEPRVAGLGPIVHDDERDAVVGGEAGQRVVLADRPHVVDEIRAGGERGLGHRGLGRVDAQGRLGQGRPQGRDDRHDPATFLVLGDRGVPGPRRFATDVEDVGTLLDHPAAGARRAASTGSSPAASSPSPENESGVTLRMPITNVRSPQAKTRGPILVVPSPAAPSVVAHPEPSAGMARIAQVGIVDELATRHPDKIERTGDHHRAWLRASAPSSAASGSGSTRMSRGARGIRAPVRGEVGRGHRPREVEARAHDGRALERGGGHEGGDDAIDILVRHRRRHERQRPVGQERPEVVERDRQRRGAGRVVRAVEQDVAVAGPDELEAPGPHGRGVARPAGRRRDRRDAGRLERVEQRIGGRDVGRLVATAQADPGSPEAWQLDLDPVTVPAEERRRPDLGQGHAEASRAPADDRQPVTVARR